MSREKIRALSKRIIGILKRKQEKLIKKCLIKKNCKA